MDRRFWGLLLVVLFISVASLWVGAADISFIDALSELIIPPEQDAPRSLTSVIIWDIRVPRLALSLAVGAALSVSGALMQAIFRNPLAEPSLVGISSGAALGAASAIFFSSVVSPPEVIRAFFVPLSAAVGGGVITLVIWWIAKLSERPVVATLLLAGLAMSSFVNACLGFLLHFADDTQLRNLTFWLLGSLSGGRPDQIAIILPFIILPTILAFRLAEQLDIVLLGESEAKYLGVDIERVKRQVVILTAVAVGASVAMSGVIGFVGLVVPHVVRLSIGPGHVRLLPYSAVGGAGLLMIADVIARTLASPMELPIGVLTAILGAPFFLWLVIRKSGVSE